jgi:hypothetical protein
MLVVMLAKPHSASAIHHHGEEGMAVPLLCPVSPLPKDPTRHFQVVV